MIALAVLLAIVLAPGPAPAAPDDFKVVDGVLAQPLVLPGQEVAAIQGEDGTMYYADLRLLPAVQTVLPAGTAVTIAGYEGERRDQMVAHVMRAKEAPEAVAPDLPRSEPLQVLNGQIREVSRHKLILRLNDGRTIEINIRGGVAGTLFRTGEPVTVFASPDEDDETYTASALVQEKPVSALEADVP